MFGGAESGVLLSQSRDFLGGLCGNRIGVLHMLVFIPALFNRR